MKVMLKRPIPDQEFIKNMKIKLEQDEKRLEGELNTFAERNIHNREDFRSNYPEFGSESDENAREVADFDVNLTLEGTLEDELRDIRDALKRIENGTYGICHKCHQPIDQKRLEARPTSSTCVKCKKELKGEI